MKKNILQHHYYNKITQFKHILYVIKIAAIFIFVRILFASAFGNKNKQELILYCFQLALSFL